MLRPYTGGMKRNMIAWVDEMIAAPKKVPLPVLSFPGVQLLNVSVGAMVADGELQAQCMKAIADRYKTAASLSNMDLSIEAEAFGAEVRFSDGEVPTVTGRIVDTEEDARALTAPSVGTGRTGENIKAVEKALTLITDRPVLAGVIGPFSLAGRLIDMTEIMVKSMLEPDTVHIVLRKVTDFLTAYIKAYKNAGANGIVMAEPAAGLLSPQLCADFSSAYIQEIISAVEDENFIVVYHNCGNTVPLVDAIVSTGARVVHLGNAINLADVMDKYPSKVLVLGNVNPAGEFRNGTKESIAQAARTLLQTLGKYPNWVISSGCDIPPMSPLENIDAFFKTTEEFYT